MKTLILLRHGKSDWNTASGIDHDRPLAPRGREAAERIGRFLSSAGLAPDRVLTSTALRARDTARLAYRAGDWSVPMSEDRRLYGASTREARAVITELAQDAGTLLVVGHEPTTSALASELIGGGYLRVVTAAVVGIGLSIDNWSRLAPGTGDLRFFVPPRMLAQI